MSTINKNNNGFTVVEFLLVLVTIAIIGVAGFFVAKHVNDSSHKKPTSTAVTLVTTSPYSGWKNYCDASVKLCFKYPSTWTLTGADSSSGVAQILVNSATTANVEYGNLTSSVGYPTTVDTSNPLSSTQPPANITLDIPGTYNFYVSSINNTASDTNYKVLGGYYEGTSENVPAYFVVNASAVSSLGLKAGKVSKLQDNAVAITNSLEPSNIILFGGGPISNNTYTASQAAAWLTSSDGKATLLLLQSFYGE